MCVMMSVRSVVCATAAVLVWCAVAAAAAGRGGGGGGVWTAAPPDNLPELPGFEDSNSMRNEIKSGAKSDGKKSKVGTMPRLSKARKVVKPRLFRAEERYLVFRDATRTAMHKSRRVFGAGAVRAAGDTWPGSCALLDDKGVSQCSCGAVARSWAVTAAHCLALQLRHIMLQRSHHPYYAPIIYVYRHPHYWARIVDKGGGPDIAELANDVALVQTPVLLFDEVTPPNIFHNMHELLLSKQHVLVYGYGMTEGLGVPNDLSVVRLTLCSCPRQGWRGSVCGCDLEARSGVCSGDSGGPVVWENQLVGVTSLGPVECSSVGGAAAQAVTVFTPLAPHAELLRQTIEGRSAGREGAYMTRLAVDYAFDEAREPPRAPAAPPHRLLLVASLAALLPRRLLLPR